MFGWRRKNEGFVWRDYVRTTIKIRREDRAKKIEELKVAAAAGAIGAGRQGVAAGRYGMLTLVRATVQTFSWMWRAIIVAARLAMAAARDLCFGIWRRRSRLNDGARWFARWRAERAPISARTKITALFVGLGFAAGLSAFLQFGRTGPEWPTLLSGFVAVVLLLLAVAPWVSKLPRPTLTGLQGFWRDWPARSAVLSFRSWSLEWPGDGAKRLIGGLAALIMAVGSGFWVWQSGGIATASSAVGSVLPLANSLPDMQGRPRALTGDTLRLNRRLVRLSGIEAPELAQICRDEKGRAWRCGRRARDELARILRGNRVMCTNIRESGHGQLEGTCTLVGKNDGGKDLAQLIVERGFAFAQGRLFRTYGDAEGQARADGRGVWQGEALRPADFRAKRWAVASKSAPDGCPIKGRVVRKAKTYVLPWAADYRQVRVHARRGERWFCSETEATSAGFQPSPTG